MGAFDISLCESYAKNSVLYDKRNLYFRDEEQTQRAWNDISKTLGYKGKSRKKKSIIF
jgi:hypothetical protein